MELLKRGVVSEAAREDAPVVDGQPVLVGAFGVEKRGFPLPPATRVLRLIVNAIPSNKQQTAIKGDIEQMPGGEWLHIALETDEIVLWSSDDIQGCFHVFSLPPSWRRWMILSKPIRVATPGSPRVSTCEDNLCHSCAASGTMGHVYFREVWLALAVIPMGWLSAVGVIQHLHRNIISRARHVRGDLIQMQNSFEACPFLSLLNVPRVGGGKSTSTISMLVRFLVTAWLQKLCTQGLVSGCL